MKAVVGFLIALTCAPLVARSEPADVPAQARALASRGRAAFNAGDYAAAILAFDEAFALAPSPPLLFDLAQAHRHVGHCEIAAGLYRRYLAAGPDPATLALAREHLAAMERCGPAQPLLVIAPRHDEPVAIVPVRHSRKRDVGIGLGLAGAAALAASVYYAVEAHNAANAVNDAYAHGGSGPAVKALDATGQHDALLGKVFGATGLAAVGAGALLFYLGLQDTRRDSITVAPDSHGAEVQVRWQF